MDASSSQLEKSACLVEIISLQSFISFQGFILVGFWILEAQKMLYAKQDQGSGTKRSPRKWKGIRSSIYGTSLHKKTLRKPFPRLTLSRRRPRSPKHPRRFPVFSSHGFQNHRNKDPSSLPIKDLGDLQELQKS